MLWFPALAIAVARDRDGWRRPRRLALAAFLFVAIAGAWLWIAENETRSGELVRFVVDTTLSRSPRPSFVWREMIVPAGSLFFLAGIVLARSLWTRPAVLGERLPLATIVLFFSFVPVAATLGIDERGAYFLSLIPPLALVACHALERLGRLRIPAALALVGGQLAWSLEEVRKWEHGYPGHEWVPALIAETRGRGTLITGDPEEAAAVWYHSELRVVCPIARAVDERSLKLRMFRTLDRAVRAGEPLAIATSVFEIQGTGIREVVERLIESHGRPVPGARSEYSLLNPPGLPAEPE